MVKKAWVRIDDKEFILHSEIKEDTVTAEVHTKKKNGERHPDFFAKQFLAFSINHFAAQGYPVSRFKASWVDLDSRGWTSDNYFEYKRVIKEGGNSIEAARSTWTGKVLTELGFTEIENIQEEENRSLEVIFKKPS